MPEHADAKMHSANPAALNCVSPCTVSNSPNANTITAPVSRRLIGSMRSANANTKRKRMDDVSAKESPPLTERCKKVNNWKRNQTKRNQNKNIQIISIDTSHGGLPNPAFAKV